MSNTTTHWPSGIVIIWDNDMPETQYVCPVCQSNRVHISSYGDGIICYRTDKCGFARWQESSPAAGGSQ